VSGEIAVADANGDAPALGARVAVGSAIAVAGLVAVLHLVKPELDPSWRFLSEYSVGAHGWLMKLAFLSWAIGCLGLFVALGRATAPRRAKVGRWALAVVAVALVAAGLFDQDPMTGGESSTHGMLHALSSLVGIPGVPIAAMLLSADRRSGRLVVILANLTWICLALMVAYIAWAMGAAGGFGPGVYAGWLNRLVVAAYVAWQFALGWRLARG
jgi:hypothetical protein